MSGHPGQNWPHTLDKAEIAHVNRRYHSQVPAVDIGEYTWGSPAWCGIWGSGNKGWHCIFFFLTFYLCKEQTFGLCGRRRGWDDLREYHWNMYITICETDRQSRFSAWDRVLRAGALGRPWGMWWGRGSWWGTHVHPWLIHVNVWQKPLQYCKVINFQLKWLN